RPIELGETVTNHLLGRAVHGRGIDQASAGIEEGAHHLRAGVARDRVVPDIEGEPAAEPDRGQFLACRGYRLVENASLLGRRELWAEQRGRTGCGQAAEQPAASECKHLRHRARSIETHDQPNDPTPHAAHLARVSQPVALNKRRLSATRSRTAFFPKTEKCTARTKRCSTVTQISALTKVKKTSRASARVNVSVLYQLLTPPSGLGLLASPRGGFPSVGRRVARSLPERWPAVLPRGVVSGGSRPSTRTEEGAAWSLPLSNRQWEWTPRRATLLCSPPCRCSVQASPGFWITLFWVGSFSCSAASPLSR